MNEVSGLSIAQSPSIENSFEEVIQEIDAKTQLITDIKESDPSAAESYQKKIDELGQRRGRPLWFPYLGSGAGRGALVELMDGSVKLDLINGIGIHVLGHSHPAIIKASLKAAVSDVVIQGNLQMNDEYFQLQKRLVDLGRKGSRLEHVWITTSGSMSNEIALKISRQKNSPARMIVAMEEAFAGRTTMMTEVGDNPAHGVGQPTYDEVLRIPFYDRNDPQSAEKSLRALKEHVAKHEGNISIFGFEPVQGEGGFKVAPREFFIPMMEFCREKGIAVWADEVQTFCRTGEFFAFQKLDIGEYLDIVTLAKTAQVAATLYTPEYNPKPGLIAGTFAGSSVALAAGNEILKTLESGFMGDSGRITAIHNKFIEVFNGLIEGSCKGLLAEADGIGLMVAVTPFGGDKAKVFDLVKKLYHNGLMCFACGHGPYRLRFLVPATITDQQIEKAGEILEKSLLESK